MVVKRHGCASSRPERVGVPGGRRHRAQRSASRGALPHLLAHEPRFPLFRVGGKRAALRTSLAESILAGRAMTPRRSAARPEAVRYGLPFSSEKTGRTGRASSSSVIHLMQLPSKRPLRSGRTVATASRPPSRPAAARGACEWRNRWALAPSSTRVRAISRRHRRAAGGARRAVSKS